MPDIPDEAVGALCSEFGMEPEFARAALTAAYPHLWRDYGNRLHAENARLRAQVEADHPLSYGYRAGAKVINPAADDRTVVERYARCPTCEEWSPCSVRIAVLGDEGKPDE